MSSRHHRRKAFFEQHAQTWDVSCTHDDEKLEEIFDILPLKKGDRILDVGTGTGIAIPYILKKVGTCGSIYAIDYAENMIMKAEEKFPQKEYQNVNFIIGDFFDLDAGKLFDSAQEIGMIAKRNGFVVLTERDDEKLFYIVIKKRNE